MDVSIIMGWEKEKKKKKKRKVLSSQILILAFIQYQQYTMTTLFCINSCYSSPTNVLVKS